MERLETGVPGLDLVLGGGLPVGATIILGGPPGAGKTITAEQILFHHAARGRRALLLTTLSEPHEKLIRHSEDFDWFDHARVGREIEFLSLYDTLREGNTSSALDVVIGAARERRIDLLVLDAFRGIRDLVCDEATLRRFIFELSGQLALLGVTALLTGEYAPQDIDRYVEFTLVDGIISLGHHRADSHHVRELEVVKLRGTEFLNGVHPLRITRAGITVYPRHSALARRVDYAMSSERVSTGVPELDTMLEGGLTGHSTTLVIGTPGVGKTLLGLGFLAEGARRGERGVMLSLDESSPHLEQKARRFGLGAPDEPFFDGDRLMMVWEPAVELEPDVVASHLRDAVEGRDVRRVVLDAFANLEAMLDPLRLSDYIVSLINYARGHGITMLILKDSADVVGAPVSVGGLTFSANADNIVLFRHVEIDNRLQRVVSVVKTRDSGFDPAVRRYDILDTGLRIGEPLRNVKGGLMSAGRLQSTEGHSSTSTTD